MRLPSSFVHDLIVLAVALVASGVVVTHVDAQQSSSDRGASQSQLTIAADSLQGTKVYDTQGKQVGSISKLMVDPNDGKISSVLIKHGGTAGLGASEITVPWSALKLQRGDKDQIIVTMQQDVLEKAPSSSDQSRKNPQPSASPATDQGGQHKQ